MAALWEQLLKGNYDPLKSARSGGGGGGYLTGDGTGAAHESSWEKQQRQLREERERADAAEEREREREQRDAEQRREKKVLDDWIAQGRGRDENLNEAHQQYGSAVEQAEALGMDADGMGDPSLLESTFRGLDWLRAATFNTAREVVETRNTHGGFDLDRLRERVDRREGAGDLDLLKFDEDDAWYERAAKATGAFVGDVAMDPLTYLTAGTASIGRKGAAEAVSVAAPRLGREVLESASDDVVRGLARRVEPTLMREQVAAAARRAGREMDASDVAAMSTGATWNLARSLTDDAGRTVADDLAERGLGAGAAQSYLEGGSRGLRQFLTDDVFGEAGEQVFRRMPNELRGGARLRVPFAKDTSELGLDLGVRLPRQVRLTAGGGQTAKWVPGLNRALDVAEVPRRLFRGSRTGQAVSSRLGRTGWSYAPMAARLADAAGDEVGQAYSMYDEIVTATRQATQASGRLDRELGEVAGALTTALKGADNRAAAERALRTAFHSRGGWDQAAVDAMEAGDEKIGYEVASQMFGVFDNLHAEARQVFGDDGAIGFLNDYLPRIAREEWLEAQRAGGRRGTGGKTSHMKSRTGVYAEWEHVPGEASPRIARFLSPDEANKAAGQEVFEADPLVVLTSYANTMKSALRQQRFLRELMDRGIIQQTGWDVQQFLSSPKMAKVGQQATEEVAAQQAAIRSAFDAFAETGDPSRLKEAMSAARAKLPARPRPGRGPAGGGEYPDVQRSRVRERTIGRDRPPVAGRSPATDVERVEVAGRLSKPDVDGVRRSADGRVEVEKVGPKLGYRVRVDGEEVPAPAPAQLEPEASAAPAVAETADGAGVVARPATAVTVAPGAVEDAARQAPAETWETVFPGQGAAEIDGMSEPVSEAVFAVNDGLDFDPIAVRARTGAEVDAIGREAGSVRPSDYEVAELRVAPELLEEVRGRVRQTFDQMFDDAGGFERLEEAGGVAAVSEALSRGKLLDFGPALPDGDEFVAWWPVIDTLHERGWQFERTARRLGPDPSAGVETTVRLKPPSKKHADLDADAAALRARGVDVDVERASKSTGPRVKTEVDLSPFSDRSRRVLSAAMRDDGRLTKQGGWTGTVRQLEKMQERLEDIVDRAAAANAGKVMGNAVKAGGRARVRKMGTEYHGWSKGAREKAGVGGVKFNQQLIEELDAAAAHLRGARHAIPDPDVPASAPAPAPAAAAGMPDAPAPTFPTLRAAREAADELVAPERAQVAEASYIDELERWADASEARAGWDDVPGFRATVEETVETPEQLAARQGKWEERAARRAVWQDGADADDLTWQAEVIGAVDGTLDDLAGDVDKIGRLFDAQAIPLRQADAEGYLDDVVETVGARLNRSPEVVREMMEQSRRKRTVYAEQLKDAGLRELPPDQMRQAAATLLDRVGAFGPEELGPALAKMYRVAGTPTDWQRFEKSVYKPYHTWFKTMATVGGGPRFFIRNIQGGMFNAWLADVTPKHFAVAGRVNVEHGRIRRQVRKELGETTTAAIDAEVARRIPDRLREVYKGDRGENIARAWEAFRDQQLDQGVMLNVYDTTGFTGAQTFRDVDARSLRQQGLRPDLADDERGRMLRAADWTMDNRAFNTLADASEGSERFLRFGTFLKGVEQWGLEDGGVAASMVVRQTQFDYSDLSEFEVKFLKNLLPFYTWSRNNIPLAARSVLSDPGKIQRVLHANDALREQYGAKYEDGDNAIMPRWVRESFGWELAGRPGEDDTPWAVNLGWWPTSDLNRTFNATTNPMGLLNTGEVRSSVNPVLKAASEAFTGTSSFTRAEFAPTETAPAWARLIPGATWETQGGERVADPKVTNFVRSTVPLVGTWDRLVEPTARMLTGGEHTEDRYRDRLGTSAAAQLLGVPVSTLDGRQQSAELRSRTDDVRDEMRKLLGSEYGESLSAVRALLSAGYTAEEIARALEVTGALPAVR